MADAHPTDFPTPFVRPDVQMILAMMAATDQPAINEVPFAESRVNFVEMGKLVDANPTELAIIRDLTCPGPAGDIRLRYYDAQAERGAGPVVMFYHGGGYVIGDLESHHPFCTEMAKQLDLPVIAVDYRLAPEHPFPAAPEDCLAATRWVAASPAELGLQVTGLIPCGDSAGGNLTVIVSRTFMTEPAAVPVIAQIPIYPLVSGHQNWGSFEAFNDGFFLTKELMTWFGEAYAAKAMDPLYEALDNGNHAGTPPTMLATAGLDPLRDQGRAYAAALIDAGVNTSYYEAKGNIHGFICMRKAIPSSQGDVDAILAGAKTLLAGIT